MHSISGDCLIRSNPESGATIGFFVAVFERVVSDGGLGTAPTENAAKLDSAGAASAESKKKKKKRKKRKAKAEQAEQAEQ
jgi:hypothetical protein